MQEKKPKYIKATAFGEHFSLSRFAVYKMITRGDIPAVKVGGSWRIPADTIESIESRVSSI